MKIFNKKNLKKGLTYTAAAIGGGVIAFAALALYGKKLEDRGELTLETKDEQIYEKLEEIIDLQEEA